MIKLLEAKVITDLLIQEEIKLMMMELLLAALHYISTMPQWKK